MTSWASAVAGVSFNLSRTSSTPTKRPHPLQDVTPFGLVFPDVQRLSETCLNFSDRGKYVTESSTVLNCRSQMIHCEITDADVHPGHLLARLLAWCLRSAGVSLSAFPADSSGIPPHAARSPADPLSRSRLGRPGQWHMTPGYHQTEKFMSKTRERLHSQLLSYKVSAHKKSDMLHI